MGLATGILIGVGVGLLCALLLLWQSHRRFRRELQRLGSLVSNPLPVHSSEEMLSLLSRQLRQQQLDWAGQNQQLQDWQYLSQRLPWGYLRVDENNVVLECNPAAQRLLRINQWQPGIKLLLEWVRSYELDQLIETTRRQEADRPTQSREWIFYPSGGDGKPIPLRGWGLPLPQSQVAIFLEDRLEAKMLTQQRDRWASDVAHELKTPLTSIRLLAETLQSRVDAAQAVWVERLLNETLRLSSLVQDLLELSALNLGAGSRLQLRSVDLAFLVRKAWQSLEPLAKPRQQELHLTGTTQACLWGDEQRLYRLLLNLLDNAIKYGRPGSPVHVVLAEEGSAVGLEVYDHGSGLAADQFELVFQPFYRTDTARARSKGGTGLGLAIVRQIVEAHEGTIRLCNHPQTGGLWVRVQLPQKRLDPL
ncbi:PAS domain-containing sensor histidine kinase [Synechococcus sp. Nb3U1]|uniref:sensor histidine kinase n=1 Tax=Synechococcus sp. Nb3U1 TaxID=1914529 RepID=UPI001F4012D9|nr:PAS domain-containing sensor histidine kinase [Synechococcus sp. Nb3U1]MCF2971113.1 PAS domain-containing sensor histidine kinase [Synechococcus sp. Nb3U1]